MNTEIGWEFTVAASEHEFIKRKRLPYSLIRTFVFVCVIRKGYY